MSGTANDGDSKIILTSQLEADEKASAQRISEQLPAIEKLIKTKGAIRVGVEIDGQGANAQLGRVTGQLRQAASRAPVGIKFDFGAEKVEELRQALANLSIPRDTVDRFIDNINAANASVRSISTSFDDVRNVVTATISGVDRMGNAISQIQSARLGDDGTAEIIRNVTAVTTDYEKLAQAEEKAAAAARKAIEDNNAKFIEWGQRLDTIKTRWAGLNPTIKQAGNIEDLNNEFVKISGTIASLDEKNGRWSKDTIAYIKAQIDHLEDMAVAYDKLENSATELRTKDVTVIKEEQNNKLDTFEIRLQTSGTLTDDLSRKIADLRVQLDGVTDSNGIKAFLDQFGIARTEAEKVRATLAQTKMSEKLEEDARRIAETMDLTGLRVEELRQKLALLGKPAGELAGPFEDVRARMAQIEELTREVNEAATAQDRIDAYRRLDTAINDCNQALTIMNRLQNGDVRDARFTESLEKAGADLDTIARQWSALKYDEGLSQQFRELSAELERIKATGNSVDFRKWSAQFSTFKSEVKAAGRNVMSFGDTLKDAIQKVGQWTSATTILFRSFRAIKTGITTVVALDTAMIDLKKTTDATEAQYKEFYRTANETAKRLNVATEAVISQTAEWSRLGYTLQEASKLAENSAIFAAVSPEMTVDEATDGLVSILKAFDIDTEDSLDGIISKVNEVGNKFAVTNKDIVDVLTRSSSAMAAANNTFEETIALATAGVEITRDAEGMGQGLKTLSMRIRGYDEETEEFSEDVAVLTGEIADLTKVASNNYAGVSLFEPGDPDTYRSTYDFLRDINEIWDELTDKNRAKLLEALFGKRQSQIGAAIIKNFSQAEAALDAMADSAGSAMEEFEMVQDSVQYKLNQFKETWTGVAINLFDTDQMKLAVDAMNALASVVEWTTGKLGLFGTTAAAVFGVQLIKSVGRPKLTGFTVPTYAPVVTLKRAYGVFVP